MQWCDFCCFQRDLSFSICFVQCRGPHDSTNSTFFCERRLISHRIDIFEEDWFGQWPVEFLPLPWLLHILKVFLQTATKQDCKTSLQQLIFWFQETTITTNVDVGVTQDPGFYLTFFFHFGPTCFHFFPPFGMLFIVKCVRLYHPSWETGTSHQFS